MRIALLLALVGSLSSPARGAELEGVLRSRMTSPGGEEGPASGTGVMYVGPAGLRMEVEVKARGQELRFTSLVLHARPGVTYHLDEARKTYTEHAVGPEELVAARRTYRVEALGREKVAGFDCAHVALTDEQGKRFELWTTRELGDAGRFWSAQARGDGNWNGMQEALHAAGADGWPLRWSEGKRGAVWETTRVERKPVSPAVFDLSGYRRSERPAGVTRLTPEQERLLDNARAAARTSARAPPGSARARARPG